MKTQITVIKDSRGRVLSKQRIKKAILNYLIEQRKFGDPLRFEHNPLDYDNETTLGDLIDQLEG